MTERPTPEQVMLLAPDRRAASAATEVADPASWSSAGCDDDAVWGRYIAGSAEPYDVAVSLSVRAYRCTCPSRKVPCKHCLGLMLLYAQQRVTAARRLPFVDEWLEQVVLARPDVDRGDTQAEVPPETTSTAKRTDGRVSAAGVSPADRSPAAGSTRDHARDRRRNDRAERMRAGLLELDRWLADRVRRGLASAELADPVTWEQVAARLVDAQCGSLANRIRRIAARVGQHARWHEDVLEELAVAHTLARGALRTAYLPDDLCDGVHAATGLSVAKADVLAGVPTSADWMVVGESRVREDRITVQRTWLCHQSGGDLDGSSRPRTTWALELSFGSLGGELVSTHEVGTGMFADVHWYPGAVPLRCLVGRVHTAVLALRAPPLGTSVADGVAEAGRLVAREPWIERVPVLVDAVPVPRGDGRWSLADSTGSVPITPGFRRLAELVAISGGSSATVMGEYDADGVMPLTVFCGARAVML
ncbi:MAG: hypothetical protein RI958_1709 [Actinomycetota bacterium]|jgi:hypothetical protein